MKPKRQTMRQKIVARLTKRIKLVCRVYPAGYKDWVIEMDGNFVMSLTGGREYMRKRRKNDIQYKASRLMQDVKNLRAQGFKVTLP